MLHGDLAGNDKLTDWGDIGERLDGYCLLVGVRHTRGIWGYLSFLGRG